MLEEGLQDVRYGLRMLWRNPAFTLVAVVTLAMGIGANTAIFSLVNGVLLKSLPYDNPHELVWVQEVNAHNGPMSVTWANFVDWQEESSSFSGLTAYGSSGVTVLGGDRPVRAQLASVSADFWTVFPVRPFLGRLTAERDFGPGTPLVAVLGKSFWLNELGGRGLDGQILEIDGEHVQVIGVIPEGFNFPSDAEIWTNLALLGQSDSRTAHNWSVVGRLAPGVTVETARQEMDVLTKRIVLRAPDATPEYLAEGALVLPLHDQIVGEARTPLILLLGAAGLVLLVACTNLASTLLARGAYRSRELAVRASLGASRSRIMRLLFTESLVLAFLGALGGVGMAILVMGGLHVFGPESLPRVAEIKIDGLVLAYAAGVALLTAFLFGLFPARRLAGRGVGEALREGGRGNTGRREKRIWQSLVGAEVALALVLLVGSGLLVRSFQALLHEDAGFDAQDTGSIFMTLSYLKHPSLRSQVDWYSEFLETLEADPTVKSAGILSTLPVRGSLPNGLLELDGDLNKQAQGAYLVASVGAFEALDIPLLRGRLFRPTDGPDDSHVAVVSQGFADRYWPGGDPIGKSVTGGGMDNLSAERPFARVVGVVGNVRFQALGQEAIPAVYFPFTQRPFRIAFGTGVVMEAANGDPAALANSVRTTLQRLDPDVPIQFGTLEALVSDSIAERRFIMLILGGFSLIALLLAGVGIYGVVSYTVAQRTREMGIRVALGANPGSVLRLVMIEALQVVFLGLAGGVLASLALSRMMRSLLYEVSPWDSTTIVSVVAMLSAAAALASWIPARGGTRVDPMTTMRAE
jgi:putative ABC transport system permease protein